MALKRNKQEEAAPEVKEPEVVEETAGEPEATGVKEPEVVETKTQETSAPEPEAKKEPATVPATRQQNATAVATSIPKGSLVIPWEDKQNLYVAAYGELPRLKATQGRIIDNDDASLGEWIELQILSFNDLYVVGPCDNKAPAELVSYSYDNVELNDGTGVSVSDHLKDLQQNWPNAASKRYIEVVAVLLASDKPSNHVGEMVQIQLAPTSVTGFNGYRKQTAFKIAMGKLPGDRVDFVRAEAEAVSSKGNDWTKIVFKTSQLA